MIQGWHSERIRVEDNICKRGDGDITQGILFNSDVSQIVAIRNYVEVDHAHGISFNGEACLAAYNTVVWANGEHLMPGINVRGKNHVVVYNTAPKIVDDSIDSVIHFNTVTG